MACCKNNLGEFPHNRDIDTGVVALQTGTHELRLKAANFTTQSLWLNVTLGGNIIIPQGNLNENFTYSFTIIQPDGTILEVTDCSNFSLTTFISTASCDDLSEYL